MTRDDDTTEPSDERAAPQSSEAEPTARGDDRAADTPPGAASRRSVLKAGAALGAGGLAVGLGDRVSAAKVEEICDSSDYGAIEVADGFSLIDNQWGNSAAEQCIWLDEDGSYGYDFDASGTGGGINYPQVLVGTKPWGSDTGVADFPVRRRNVDELTIDVEADYSESGGEWDWAEEWWLLEEPVGEEPETHQYEIMLLLDWNDQHDHGGVEATGLWTDQYGNTVDHWVTYGGGGGTNAEFYIFRIQGGHDGGKIDLKPIVDYLTDEHGVSKDLWLSGIELGNEYWPGSTGQTTYETFDVTVNGTTYASGSGESADNGGDTDTPTPTQPPTDTPTDTPTDEPDTPTDDPGGGDGGAPADALVVNDYDGDPSWSASQNDLGEWCGAGSFENGSGEVVDGALVLEYDNGGWFQTQINRDVSDYDDLVLGISGANGGEESEVLFDMGGVRTVLADVTDDSIGTTASDVRVDLASAGVDRSSPSLRLNFWQGGSSTLTIEEVRLE
ncbi:hypothetical protein HZS55_07510 [Halosimplex rubrum]|uniref:Uncharacterized protein n=1 Tax=Halosimplex rubrum TaxID=869889 RepID=A0A7D5SX74_9EURY|nr:hypothetical protein [Halosimplex rubrum]QLH77151.1 hypothetical protein HZS55_07510 [Halosimplex rubrum]